MKEVNSRHLQLFILLLALPAYSVYRAETGSILHHNVTMHFSINSWYSRMTQDCVMRIKQGWRLRADNRKGISGYDDYCIQWSQKLRANRCHAVFLFAGLNSHANNCWIWPSAILMGALTTWYTAGFAPALRTAKLRTIRFHDLRHTNVSLRIEQG